MAVEDSGGGFSAGSQRFIPTVRLSVSDWGRGMQEPYTRSTDKIIHLPIEPAESGWPGREESPADGISELCIAGRLSEMRKGLALAFGLLACALSVCQANAPQGFIRAQVTLKLASSRKLNDEA